MPAANPEREGVLIDALSVVYRSTVPFTPVFFDLYRDARRRGRIRPVANFKGACDFRPYGLEARVSFESQPGIKTDHGREARHRIDFYNTGEKTVAQMRATALTIFDESPDAAHITRIDLCADVDGVPVEWFSRRVTVAYKRCTRELMTIQKVGKGTIETWYAGKKPNQIRIYDKTAERAAELRRDNLARKRNGEEPLSFQERWNYDPHSIITRIERQYGGGKISEFGKLAQLRTAKPFASMALMSNGKTEAELEARAGDVEERLAGKMIRRMAEEKGVQFTRAWIRAAAGKNAYRTWKRFEPWARCESGGVTIDAVHSLYLASLEKQLAQL